MTKVTKPNTLVEAPKEAYLSIPTDDGLYRYDFLHNPDDKTAKGLPRAVSHKLVNCETGATLVGGNVFMVPSSWELPQLQKKMSDVLKDASARMFFKSIARKPELWSAWEYHDYAALREAAPRYVYLEEVIKTFYKDVLDKEYHSRTPDDKVGYFHRVKSTEKFRGNFNGYAIHVKRTLEMFCPSSQLGTANVSYEFSAPSVTGKERNPGSMTLWFEYPLAEWPLLKSFTAEPRVAAMLTAWIDSTWNDKQRAEAREPDGERRVKVNSGNNKNSMVLPKPHLFVPTPVDSAFNALPPVDGE